MTRARPEYQKNQQNIENFEIKYLKSEYFHWIFDILPLAASQNGQ